MNGKKIGMLAMMLLMVAAIAPAAFATDLSATFDANPGDTATITFNLSGTVDILARGHDTSAWHTGAVGQSNEFLAIGDVSGTFQTTGNSWGALPTYINAQVDSGTGGLCVYDSQDVDVLSANHNTHVTGQYYAEASGTSAKMNMKFIGWGASPGGWQEATNPSSPCLSGNYIEKSLTVYQSNVWQGQPVTQGDLDLWVSTDGTATMSNSNIWGWGVSEIGQATTNYGGPTTTRTVSATGSGSYFQGGYGLDYLDFNGFVMGSGGTMTQSGSFTSGLTGTYSMTGR